MEVPYNGNVNIRLLVKFFKNKVFYRVDEDNYGGSFKVTPCLISEKSIIKLPFTYNFDENMKLNETYSQGVRWDRLFETIEEARFESKRLTSLYNDGFYRKPYLKQEKLEKHKEDLLKIEKAINKLLTGFDGFLGIDFCDVSANGIQIRGFHKKITRYCFGNQITIKYDFSNKEEVIRDFVFMWYQHDTLDEINGKLSFIRQGEKYGWD